MAGGSRRAPAVGLAPPPQRGARGVRGRFALVLLVAVHLLDVVARGVEERIIVLVGLASFGPIVVVGIGRGIEEVARYGGPHGLEPVHSNSRSRWRSRPRPPPAHRAARDAPRERSG